MPINCRLLVLLVLCCSVAVVTPLSTAGVSSVSASRGAIVTVATDSEAYLGVTREVVSENPGGNTLFVNVTNRVPGEETLSVRVKLVGDEVRGESRDVTSRETTTFHFANTSCDTTLDIVAVGSETRIELERGVPCLSTS